MKEDNLSPWVITQKTGKWARIMTKWLITKSGGANVRWQFVVFLGPKGGESRGIVDIVAIRKNHKPPKPGLKRGNLLDMVLIQTKGGSSPLPSKSDLDRLVKVKKEHRARSVVLAQWKKGEEPNLYELVGRKWQARKPPDIFR